MRERCVKLLGSDCDEKKPFPYGTFAMNISKVAEVLPLLKRIDHVGIAVSDLDSAKDFYFRTFGLHVVHEESNEEQGIREAMIAIGDSESYIQLLAPLSQDSVIAKFLDKSGPGVQQIAYEVDDVVQVTDLLKTRGVRMVYEHPRRGTGGSLVNFAHPRDCGGVLIEFVQHTAQSRD